MSVRFVALTAVLVCAAVPIPTRADDLPHGLQHLPSEGAIFLHARVGDLYADPTVKKFLPLLNESVIKELDEGPLALFALKSTDIDTVSISFANFEGGGEGIILLSTKKPYDQDAIRKKAKKDVKVTNPDFIPVENDTGVIFLSPTVLGISPLRSLPDLKAAAKKKGRFAPLIADCAAGKHLFLFGLDPNGLPKAEILANLPRDAEPFKIFFDADLLTVAARVDTSLRLEAKVAFADNEKAIEAEKILKLAVEVLRLPLAEIEREAERDAGKDIADALKPLFEGLRTALNKADVGRTEKAAHLKLAVALSPDLLAGFEKVRQITEADAPRRMSQNNLKQIGLAMHTYHDVYNGMPPAAICDKRGKRLLSWRVAILPYIEQQALYQEFKLDEPWDSEHNKKLIAKMPKTYVLPGRKQADGVTHYRAFVGKEAALDWLTGSTLVQFEDGTSNTIMVAEAADGVPWTKPDDLDFTADGPLPKLGFFFRERCNVLFGDGSVRTLKPTIDPKTLKALITRSGGEVIPDLD